MDRTLLIDGDIIAYKIAAAIETPINWGEHEDTGIDVWTLHAFPEDGKYAVDKQINGFMRKLEADDLMVALTDRENFRKQVDPSYKANRIGTRKPMLLGVLRDHIVENYPTFIRPGLEADDVIGILMTNPKIIKGEKISVSVDKDFKTIPGAHFNITSEETQIVDEHEADYWHLHQALTGDSTDGYKGCPGIGKVGATKLLEKFYQGDQTYEEVWEDILKAFEKKELGPDEAIKQARLARILRHEDYNYKTKKPILWTPKEVVT